MKRLPVICILFLLTACNRKWTEKDKSEFFSGCVSSAVRDKNIGDSLARPYCQCLLGKVVEKYPNASDAKYIRYDTTVVQLSRDCLKKL